MLFRNIKTGVMVDVLSEIKGANWVKVGGGKPAKAAIVTPEPEPVVEKKADKPKRKTTRRSKKSN